MLTLPVELVAVHTLPPPHDPAWRTWLSSAELAYCAGLERVADHLAARVAGKRAVLAALGRPAAPGWPVDGPWREIEIRPRQRGGPTVVLHGALDTWRGERGLPVPGVSLSHAADHAAAISWLRDVESAAKVAEAAGLGSCVTHDGRVR